MPPVPRDLVDQLYTAHPDGFVAARNEAAAAARSSGDTEAAREIARLRKPTVAAWLVNLLALRRPELMAELVELAEALRRAQRELRGEQLRRLATRRRELVGTLVAQARTLAGQAGVGRTPGKLPLADVEATLHAALADEEVARQVRSGRLVRPVTYAGFGEVPRPRLRLLPGGAVTGAGDDEPTVPDKPADRRRRHRAEQAERDTAARAERDRAERTERAERAAELAARRRALRRELTAARQDQQHAEEELERVQATQRAGAAALAELEARLAELERHRAAAENEVSRCELARKSAQRALVNARRRVGEVQAALEALEAEERTGRGR